jgi:hypothetical protein
MTNKHVSLWMKEKIFILTAFMLTDTIYNIIIHIWHFWYKLCFNILKNARVVDTKLPKHSPHYSVLSKPSNINVCIWHSKHQRVCSITVVCPQNIQHIEIIECNSQAQHKLWSWNIEYSYSKSCLIIINDKNTTSKYYIHLND